MIERHCQKLLHDLMEDFPAVLLNGARQCGKSTLAQQLVASGVMMDYVTLDDRTSLSLVKGDPDAYLAQFNESLVIDEVQRVPDLMRALKKNIDENRQPGRFFLTGSANVLSYPGVTESLAGRMAIVSLEGLSLNELEKKAKPSAFVDELFSDLALSKKRTRWRQQSKKHAIEKHVLCERIFYGGYPEVALKANSRFFQAWFSAYVQAYVERDVRNLNKIFDSVAFTKLFNTLGLQTGNLVNVQRLSSHIGMDQRTASRYMHIFDLTYQTIQLQPFFMNRKKRVIKTPKIYTRDSGLACFLADLASPKELYAYSDVGAIFETWLFAELRKICYRDNTKFYFYKTHTNKEVDFILHRGQQYVGIECKFKSSITAKDFSGLQEWQKDLKKTPLGVVIYCGDQVVQFGDNLIALPVGCLC